MIIRLPKGFMNTGITDTNYFVADTNDSANWDTMRIQLPKGRWGIKSVRGREVTLKKKRRRLFFSKQ